MSNQRAEIVAAISKAGSLAEQARLVAELDAYDANQRRAAQAAREIDLADAVVRDTLSPVRVHEFHTASTEWLGDFEAEQDGNYHQASLAEAAMWFGRVSPEVKADREEFGVQAEGFARRTASRYGDQAGEVRAAMLNYLGFLHRREAASGLDQVQQTVDPHEDPKPTPLNPQVFDNFAPEVHPINEGTVGTETSERNPLLQEVMGEGGGQGQPEKPGGHSTTDDFTESYSEVPAEATDSRTASYDDRSVAISHTMTLDDFRRNAASGLDQVQQVVDPHEDPAPTPLPTEVAFPWLISEDEYENGGDKAKKDVEASRAPFGGEVVSRHVRESAMNDTSDCRICGSELPAQSGTVQCKDCGTTHHLQSNESNAGRAASKRGSRKQADMFGNSDLPHGVPQPGVANDPGSRVNPGAGAAEGRSDAQAGDAPTFADASSAVPGNVRDYSQAYGETAQQVKDGQPKDVPVSLGGDNGQATARRSDAFVKAAARQNPEFRKAYAYATKWAPGTPLVTTGSAEFESGLYAGMADASETNRRAFYAAHQRMAARDSRFATRMAIHAAYTKHLSAKQAATTTDLDTTLPSTSADPGGQTPINGPGTPPPLDGGMDAAAPGGPAPYNGAAPFGAPVVPTGPAPAAPGSNLVNDIPGGPLDGNAKAMAFRRTVQANLLKDQHTPAQG